MRQNVPIIHLVITMNEGGADLKLHGIRLSLVSLEKIVPIYVEQVPNSRLRKLSSLLKQGKQLSSCVIVEQDTIEDKYWLVAGFPEYKAYCQVQEISNISTKVPCVIQLYSDETEQRIKLLMRMFHHQTTSWLDKHVLINDMVCKGKDIPVIAKELGMESAEIQKYLIHRDIPQEIRESAIRNDGSFLTLEKIRNLSLNPFIEYRLYRAAVFPKRHPHRLTTDKLQKVNKLIKKHGFCALEKDDQWELIQEVLEYKQRMEEEWDKKIREKLEGRNSFKLKIPQNPYNRSEEFFVEN